MELNYSSIPKLQWFHSTFYWTCDYLSLLELTVNRVSILAKGHPGVDLEVDCCSNEFVHVWNGRYGSSSCSSSCYWGTSVGVLLIGPLGANFGEIWIKIKQFWKSRSAKRGNFISASMHGGWLKCEQELHKSNDNCTNPTMHQSHIPQCTML